MHYSTLAWSVTNVSASAPVLADTDEASLQLPSSSLTGCIGLCIDRLKFAPILIPVAGCPESCGLQR